MRRKLESPGQTVPTAGGDHAKAPRRGPEGQKGKGEAGSSGPSQPWQGFWNFKCHWRASSRDMTSSGSGCCVWSGFERGPGIPVGIARNLHGVAHSQGGTCDGGGEGLGMMREAFVGKQSSRDFRNEKGVGVLKQKPSPARAEQTPVY